MSANYNLILERDILQLVSLDTAKRPDNRPVGDFLFNTLSNFNGITRLGLRDLTIITDIPVINVYNRTFTCNGVSVSLANGFYDTEASLGTAIKTALDSALPALAPFTVNYSTITRRYTITNNTSAVMSFVVGIPCSRTTGLFTNTTPTNSYVSNTPTLIYTHYIDIISNRLSSFTRTDEFLDGRFNVLERYYIDRDEYLKKSSFGEYQNIKWMRYPSKMNFGYIDIQLRDEYGNILEVGQNVGAQFRMIFTFMCKQDLEVLDM
jgi:hypothetical protein